MKTWGPAYDSSEHSHYAWKLEHLRWPHGIELVQHWETSELDRFGALWLTAELWGFWLEYVVSPYVVYLLEGHMYCQDILLYEDAAAKYAIDRAIS